MSNVVTLDDYRAMEDIVKRELQCETVILIGVNKDEVTTYISNEMRDIDLVYAIQTVKDRRQLRLEEEN